MKKSVLNIIVSIGIIFLINDCKEVYNPPVKVIATGYLVAEGNIVAGNDSTIINLSRTIPVSDTSIVQPEINASVKVESNDGDSYQLKNESNGLYDAAPLNINPTKNYRLHIFTADGNEYASDFVPVKISPSIDSISWHFTLDSSVTIYASTHDAENNTQYYQWNYTETWQHRTTFTSRYVYENGYIRERLPNELINNCWTVLPSSSIAIASTTQLSSDVLYEQPLVNIPFANEKLDIVYSILVKQNALTKEGFEFWNNLKKNTENLGTIFDPQPFADFGNLHCITNPAEPAIGFISAGSVTQKRIYIYKSELASWSYKLPLCNIDTLQPNDNAEIIFGSNAYVPLYMVSLSGSIGTVFLYTDAECADCRLHGGTTIKPSYMP